MNTTDILSLDIGSFSTKGIICRDSGKGLKVIKKILFRTPDGTAANGNLIDVPTLSATIRDHLIKNAISAKKVVFSITSSDIITREFTLPTKKTSEIKQMIGFEVEKALPIQMDQYIIEFFIIQSGKNKSENSSRIFVAATPKEIVEKYWQLAEMLKLQPLVLTIHACNIAAFFNEKQIINGREFDPVKTTAILDIGHVYTECNIIKNGNILFHRTIQLGGKNFLSEARSANTSDVAAAQDAVDVDEIKVGIWLQEIQRGMRYYSSMNTGNPVENIILTGGCSDIKMLPSYISDSLEIPAEVLTASSIIQESEKTMRDTCQYFINTLGALIKK
ncbi:pilus assembly protein PilM [Dehalobacter sp. DCM]|uniref:pilus assembly protein PilM n=1 Tax=Dehalobacter sp. DCM TaxID=2907827 RepID=UPI0030816F23|nr:pilus assembly protein PilM [Dehalobacter sp. DCM]